jgi:hypothetical protein
VLISQIGQDAKADVVFGKALRVLPETKLLKPVSDLLHRGSAPRIIGLHPPASTSLPSLVRALERCEAFDFQA